MMIGKHSKLLPFFITILFFVGIYYYFYSLADHVVYVQNDKVLFLFDSEYLKGFLRYPGGFSQYISSFFAQFFYYKWLGVAIITLLAILSSVATSEIYKKLSDNRIQLMHLLPPIMMVALYVGSTLVLFIGYILTALAFLVYLKITKENVKILVAIAAFILIYFISGVFAIIFLASCFIYELIHYKNQKTLILLISYIVLIALIPLASWRWLFVISLKNAFLTNLPHSLNPGPIAFKIGYVCFLPLLPIISKLQFSQKTGKLPEAIRITIPLIAIVLLSLSVVKKQSDKTVHIAYQIDQLAGEERWIDLLQFSAENPGTYDINSVYTNLALYKTGNLPWDMFKFYQVHNEDGLIPKWRKQTDALRPGSDIYYHLGLNNGAYRWAFESYVTEGATYKSLKRLVLSSIINKDYGIADKYISILEKTIFHKTWAKKYRTFLYDDLKVETDPLLGEKVKHLIHKNSFIPVINNKPALLYLLESNPNNNMAFEYLMAHYLLQKDINGFAKHINYIRNFKYPNLPSSYEEALLIHQILSDNEKIDFGDYNISEETQKGFNDYSQIFAKYRSNKEQAERALRQQFRGTYWYYYHFMNIASSEDHKSMKVDR